MANALEGALSFHPQHPRILLLRTPGKTRGREESLRRTTMAVIDTGRAQWHSQSRYGNRKAHATCTLELEISQELDDGAGTKAACRYIQ